MTRKVIFMVDRGLLTALPYIAQQAGLNKIQVDALVNPDGCANRPNDANEPLDLEPAPKEPAESAATPAPSRTITPSVPAPPHLTKQQLRQAGRVRALELCMNAPGVKFDKLPRKMRRRLVRHAEKVAWGRRDKEAIQKLKEKHNG